jgi:hypothetical protein
LAVSIKSNVAFSKKETSEFFDLAGDKVDLNSDLWQFGVTAKKTLPIRN